MNSSSGSAACLCHGRIWSPGVVTRSGHHMPAETIQLPAVVLVLMSAALGTVVGAQFLDKVDISSAVKMLEGAYQFVSIK